MALIELATKTPEISALIELACYTSACRPPTSGGTGGSSPSLSTRKITSKKLTHPLHGLGTELSEISTATAAKQAVRIVQKVAGFGHLSKHPGMQKGASEKDQKALVDAIVDQVSDNVIEVYDRSTTVDVSRQWYDAANKLSLDMAAKYGVSMETAAAVVATLSPQADWNHNVKLADMVLAKVTGRDPLSSDDVRAVNDIALQQHAAAIEAWEGRGSNPDNKPPVPRRLDPDTVRSSDDLTDLEMAYYVRHASGERHSVPEMTLTGDKGYAFGPELRNKPTKQDPQGVETALRWQQYGALADAVSVIRNPSMENISDRLGGAHKVRSFFNNIAYPDSSQPDVTMDTHAFGIAFRMPVTSSHPVIKSGGNNVYNTPNDNAAGTTGVHVLLAEGYRRATARVNRRRSAPNPPLRPREMQSITWEQWKHDYPAEFRSTGEATGTLPRSEAVLRQHDAGTISTREMNAALKEVRGS